MRRTIWIAVAAAIVALTGVETRRCRRSDGCAADARHSYASVELFRERNCTGASVSVGFTGNRDRPDFSAFANYKASCTTSTTRATRSPWRRRPACGCSMARDYAGLASDLLCAPPNADGLFADLGALVNRASSMRVCPASTPSGCDAAAPAAAAGAGSQRHAGQPERTAHRAASSAAAPGRRLRFGRGARVRIGLVDEAGRPIAGAALQVLTREIRSGSEWQLAPALTTDAGGRARLPLAAGSSRRVRLEYRAARR